jgi:asparagine synthase (glutamine-hydrolysing)
MCDAIRHRGPDDAGYHTAPGVAIGMRRLSIIDLPGGSQPIGNEDGSVQVVFNGEIYNYRELRTELIAAGHRFRTDSDTEVLVHLYEERGERLVHSLRGMFAFAVWDAKRQRLLLARDRLGIKPLYYWGTPQRLAFASELKSLQRLEGFPSRIDPRAVGQYLALGYVPEPDCIFGGVRKLRPGYFLTWEKGREVEVSRYWSPAVAENSCITEADAAAELRRLLTEAVRYRLIADVPLGAFLSGGVDSSAVVAEMGRQMERPVRTFSIGFEEPEYNEAPHAAAVAAALGTEHTELIVTPDADALVERVIAAFDEPFADSSAIPTLLVSELARKHVTVVLSGDGGDEIFGGYTRYFDFARRNVPHGLLGRRRLLELSRSFRGRYAGMVAVPLAVAEGGIANPEVADAAGSLEDLFAGWFHQFGKRDELTQITLVDALSYLPGDILTKVDRMSMAVSLEARVPLLDHPLVEFAASLPAAFKFRQGQGKWIFRKAVADLVPPPVLRKPKQGFGVPLDVWFRGPLRHRIDRLLRSDAPVREYVDGAALTRLADEHQRARRNHAGVLWRALVLNMWLESSRRAESESSASAPLEVVG